MSIALNESASMSGLGTLNDLKFPSLPRVAARLLSMVQDPDVDIGELGRTLEMDPALASRIVRLSNSSLFGLSREVTSVQQAIVVLGLRTVKLAVISATAVSAFPPSKTDEKLMECWRRVLTNAMGCRLAARLFQLDPEEAFLAGMMQDIVILLFASTIGPRYYPLLERSQSDDGDMTIAELENLSFGINHAKVGAKLLESWHFPTRLIDAVARHHDVDLPLALKDRSLDLAGLLAMVECITEFLLHPTLNHFQHFNVVAQAYGAAIPDGDSELDKFLQRLETQVATLADLLDLHLPLGRSYEQVLQEAREMAETLSSAPSLVDSQTGLLHRDALSLRVRQEMSMARRRHWPLSVVLARIQSITDLKSQHRIDDAIELIQNVAMTLQNLIRDSDSLFRFDAETFCLLASDTPHTGVIRLIDRVQPVLAGHKIKNETGEGPARIAFGVVTVNVSDIVHDGDRVLDLAIANLGVATQTSSGIHATEL